MTNFITVEGYRIAYSAAGSSSNPPVLFLHGLMSHRGVWSRTIETLRWNFHCIAIDHLGFGDSDKPEDANYSIAKQAERALKAADHFGFKKFDLVGHSMGGQIATYLAAVLAPHHVRKLVSVDGVVTGELSHRAQTLNRPLVVASAKIPALYTLILALCNASKPYADWAFQIWFYKIKEMSLASWELDRRMAMNPEISHSANEAWSSLSDTDLTRSLKNIVAPTLVIFGEQDGSVPVEQAHIFKEQLPAAQLEIIDQCGHFPMYEEFDKYIARLEEFLREA